MTYKTSDIVLASTLKVMGFQLQSIEILESEGHTGVFIFASQSSINDKDVEQVVDDFEIGALMVEPANFQSTLRQLTSSVRRKINKR